MEYLLSQCELPCVEERDHAVSVIAHHTSPDTIQLKINSFEMLVATNCVQLEAKFSKEFQCSAFYFFVIWHSTYCVNRVSRHRIRIPIRSAIRLVTCFVVCCSDADEGACKTSEPTSRTSAGGGGDGDDDDRWMTEALENYWCIDIKIIHLRVRFIRLRIAGGISPSPFQSEML